MYAAVCRPTGLPFRIPSAELTCPLTTDLEISIGTAVLAGATGARKQRLQRVGVAEPAVDVQVWPGLLARAQAQVVLWPSVGLCQAECECGSAPLPCLGSDLTRPCLGSGPKRQWGTVMPECPARRVSHVPL